MNRILCLLFALAVMLITAIPAHAGLMRKDMGLIRGKVLEYRPKTRALTVEGSRGEGKVKFDISGAQVTVATNPGEEVVVIYKIEGNRATIVKPPPQR